MILKALEIAYKLGKQKDIMRIIYGFMPFLQAYGLSLLSAKYALSFISDKHIKSIYESTPTVKDHDKFMYELLYGALSYTNNQPKYG